MTMDELTKLFDKEGVKYVIENYTPIIISKIGVFKDTWKEWNQKLQDLGYTSSWGVRAEYDE